MSDDLFAVIVELRASAMAAYSAFSISGLGGDPVNTGAVLLQELAELRRVLDAFRADVEHALGGAMGEYRTTILGVGTLERHRDKRYRHGDDEGLLRAVLDSRLVNSATGELIEETPVDRIVHVWRLSATEARKTALDARRIAKDEFCTVERGHWKIQIK
jgi:hypothetical protein